LLLAMTIPAAANIALCLVLVPRFGLPGAMWATTASYALGLAASLTLGRLAHAMPIPLAAIAKAAFASALMAAAVAALPALGGALELAIKASVGILAYGLAAYALDIGGLRSRAGDLTAMLRSRIALRSAAT
jgi:O-antigen/teichoic acid export membrane protein